MSDDCPGWAKSQSSKDADPVLEYFDGRGMGEVARFVLAYTGHKYTEHLVNTREEFLRLRDEVQHMPFGQLPVLRVRTGRGASASIVNISQTQAIVEHISHLYEHVGLLGPAGEPASRATVYVDSTMLCCCVQASVCLSAHDSLSGLS